MGTGHNGARQRAAPRLGTAPALGRHRVIQHLIWRRADAEWIQWQAFPRPLSGMPTRFMARLGLGHIIALCYCSSTSYQIH
jgi:hypothetical protein